MGDQRGRNVSDPSLNLSLETAVVQVNVSYGSGSDSESVTINLRTEFPSAPIPEKKQVLQKQMAIMTAASPEQGDTQRLEEQSMFPQDARSSQGGHSGSKASLLAVAHGCARKSDDDELKSQKSVQLIVTSSASEQDNGRNRNCGTKVLKSDSAAIPLLEALGGILLPQSEPSDDEKRVPIPQNEATVEPKPEVRIVGEEATHDDVGREPMSETEHETQRETEVQKPEEAKDSPLPEEDVKNPKTAEAPPLGEKGQSAEKPREEDKLETTPEAGVTTVEKEKKAGSELAAKGLPVEEEKVEAKKMTFSGKEEQNVAKQVPKGQTATGQALAEERKETPQNPKDSSKSEEEMKETKEQSQSPLKESGNADRRSRQPNTIALKVCDLSCSPAFRGRIYLDPKKGPQNPVRLNKYRVRIVRNPRGDPGPSYHDGM